MSIENGEIELSLTPVIGTSHLRALLHLVILTDRKKGCPPTAREWSESLGISTAATHNCVRMLRKKGYMKRSEPGGKQSRAFVLSCRVLLFPEAFMDIEKKRAEEAEAVESPVEVVAVVNDIFAASERDRLIGSSMALGKRIGWVMAKDAKADVNLPRGWTGVDPVGVVRLQDYDMGVVEFFALEAFRAEMGALFDSPDVPDDRGDDDADTR